MIEKRYEEKNYFGFSLNHSSSVILFLLALRFLISFISTLYQRIFDLVWMITVPELDDCIFVLINFVLAMISFMIMLYTLFYCLKMRKKNHIFNENEGVKWFGFELNKTSTAVLFFMALIYLIGFFIGIYSLVFANFLYWSIYTDFYLIHSIVIPNLLLLLGTVIMVLIYVYTMYSCISFLKKSRIEIDPTINENKSKVKLFKIELNENSGTIIFILALTGAISYVTMIIFYILSFTSTTNPGDFMNPNLLYLILPLIYLGIYLHSLDSCLDLKKFHLNNQYRGIRLFGFKLNEISASVLYVMSILGLISFLSILIEFINDAIRFLSYFDNLYQFFTYFIYSIIDLIKEIFIFVIYLYTIQRCTKVRKE